LDNIGGNRRRRCNIAVDKKKRMIKVTKAIIEISVIAFLLVLNEQV